MAKLWMQKSFQEPLSPTERKLLLSLFGLIALLVAFDLLTDAEEGVPWYHLLFEFILAAAAGAGFLILVHNSFYKANLLRRSREVLVEREKELERWKAESQKYVQGLSHAIDAQLERWALTPSEKEVALLLLKGLSLKEVADIRHTAEKTVRAQSVAVYSKSGLSGRSELSAYFLEDLLLPAESP